MGINIIVENKIFVIRTAIAFKHHADLQIPPPLNANTKCNTDPPCTL